MDGFDPNAWKNWDARSQEVLANRLDAALGSEPARLWFCTRGRTCDGKPHEGFDYPHARGQQWPPPGSDWTTWFVSGGRGGGKTATGSQYTRKVTEKVSRSIIIGPTVTHVRDVMVEGESGILAAFDAAKVRCLWEPSKRRITNLANDHVIHTFTGEEPGRLRGPQCLVAGTMVATEAGQVPIEQVKVGDRVWTRGGLRYVTHTATNLRPVMAMDHPQGRLVGTPDHRVWTENRGWVEMQFVRPDDRLVRWCPTFTRPAAGATSSPLAPALSCMPAGCGYSTTATPGSGRSTTSTATAWTTGSRTSSPSLPRSTERSTGAWSATTSVAGALAGSSRPTADLASGAPSAPPPSCARADGAPTPSDVSVLPPARSAAASSAPATAPSAPSGASTSGPIATVYDLTVAGEPEFYADGLLVHNSGFLWLDEPAHMPLIEEVWDMAMFGLRLGKRPHALCTTTPLPTPWVRKIIAEEDTEVVVITTYDNLDNLAPTFRKAVLSKYEGTRLGDQELLGRILEDVEGALWSWPMIESGRSDLTHEDMDYVVVGIDPNGTASKKRDEAGIVAVGRKGNDLYLLADASGHYTPDGWAKAAWKLFDRLGADKIVAEKNYGGEMVRATLEGARKDFGGSMLDSVELVNSRRGKQLRAEPIVGLYEQGRFHHAGTFPEVETQMTTWVPGFGDSPDRVDALVHAATDAATGSGGSMTIHLPRGRFDTALSTKSGYPTSIWSTAVGL